MNRVMHRFPEPSLPSPSLGIVPSFKSWQLLFSCPRPFTSSSGHPSPMLIILYTLFLSLSHPRPYFFLGSFTPSKGWPTRRRRRPIRPYSCPPCLLRRQYRYRSGTGSPRRSLLAGPSAPSSRPPRTACARPTSSSRGTVAEAAVARGARWQGSAGWSCVGSQSHGSSECRAGTVEHQRRASG
jgi:hypothetical protein